MRSDSSRYIDLHIKQDLLPRYSLRVSRRAQYNYGNYQHLSKATGGQWSIMDDIRPQLNAQPTRFIDQLRSTIRQRGLSYATEKTYVHWVLRFIRFHQKRHPESMGSAEIEQFLGDLAERRRCATATQRLALNASVTTLAFTNILRLRQAIHNHYAATDCLRNTARTPSHCHPHRRNRHVYGRDACSDRLNPGTPQR